MGWTCRATRSRSSRAKAASGLVLSARTSHTLFRSPTSIAAAGFTPARRGLKRIGNGGAGGGRLYRGVHGVAADLIVLGSPRSNLGGRVLKGKGERASAAVLTSVAGKNLNRGNTGIMRASTILIFL
jgi:hypothetical protein